MRFPDCTAVCSACLESVFVPVQIPRHRPAESLRLAPSFSGHEVFWVVSIDVSVWVKPAK